MCVFPCLLSMCTELTKKKWILLVYENILYKCAISGVYHLLGSCINSTFIVLNTESLQQHGLQPIIGTVRSIDYHDSLFASLWTITGFVDAFKQYWICFIALQSKNSMRNLSEIDSVCKSCTEALYNTPTTNTWYTA